MPEASFNKPLDHDLDSLKNFTLISGSTASDVETNLLAFSSDMESGSVCSIKLFTGASDPFDATTYIGTLKKEGDRLVVSLRGISGVDQDLTGHYRQDQGWTWQSFNRMITALKVSENLGTNTLANIQTAIVTLVGTMANAEQRNITFTISTAAAPFQATTYIGYVERISSTRIWVHVSQAMNITPPIYGRYKDGTWGWGSPAMQSTVDTLSTTVSGKVSGPETVTSGALAAFDGTNGRALKNTGKVITDATTSTAMPNNANIPTNRAVRNAIYNGLDKTAAGFALDARQGKELNTAIAKKMFLSGFDGAYFVLGGATGKVLSLYKADGTRVGYVSLT